MTWQQWQWRFWIHFASCWDNRKPSGDWKESGFASGLRWWLNPPAHTKTLSCWTTCRFSPKALSMRDWTWTTESSDHRTIVPAMAFASSMRTWVKVFWTTCGSGPGRWLRFHLFDPPWSAFLVTGPVADVAADILIIDGYIWYVSMMKNIVRVEQHTRVPFLLDFPDITATHSRLSSSESLLTIPPYHTMESSSSTGVITSLEAFDEALYLLSQPGMRPNTVWLFFTFLGSLSAFPLWQRSLSNRLVKEG